MAKITVNNPKNVIASKVGKNYFKLVNTGGPKGDKGDTGTAATISAGTASSLPAGSSPTVTNSGTSSAAIFNFGIPKGDKGDKGDTGATGAAATITVGSTTTGAAGTNASVTNTGTSGAAVLNFTIPRGNKGETGATGATGQAATIAVGSTTTLAPGSNATVANSGTSSAATFDFGIPQGAKGDTGATGKVQSVYVSELPASGDDNTFYLVDKNIQTQTASGSVLSFTNNKNYGSLWLDQLTGNATQNGTPTPSAPVAVNTTTGENVVKITGKNFISLQDSTNTSAGVDFAVNNGTITVSGTTTEGSYAETDSIIPTLAAVGNYPAYVNITEANSLKLPAGTYTLSAEITKSGNVAVGLAIGVGVVGARPTTSLKLEVGINTANGTYTRTATVSVAEGQRIYPSVWYEGNSTNKTVGLSITNIQLELGSTATTYEPYQGQEYEVNLGKNLFDKDNYNLFNGYFNGTPTGSITANANNDIFYIPCEPSTTYTVSKTASKNFAVASSSVVPSAGSAFSNRVSANDQPSATITTDATAKYLLIWARNGNISGEITRQEVLDTLQIERGSQATSYSAYFTPIELAKIGTYQDRIYKDDGKWYVEKQVGKRIFDGSSDESWRDSWQRAEHTDYIQFYIRKSAFTDNYIPSTLTNTMCDHFQVPQGTPNSVWSYRGNAYALNPDATYTLQFKIERATVATLADWRTWLASNPTTVYYALATPTTTEITDSTLLSQLNFIANLYGGTNNITLVGTGAQGEMDISYQFFDQYNKHNVYIWNDDINDWQIIMQ